MICKAPFESKLSAGYQFSAPRLISPFCLKATAKKCFPLKEDFAFADEPVRVEGSPKCKRTYGTSFQVQKSRVGSQKFRGSSAHWAW